MVKVQITELGNNVIGFYLFNDYKQQVRHYRRNKDQKSKELDRLKKEFMGQGNSIFVDDQTFNPEWIK